MQMVLRYILVLLVAAVDLDRQKAATTSTPQESCKVIDNYSFEEEYKLVDNCVGVTTNSSTAEKCVDTSLTIVGKIPVTNVQTGVTFQNVYCALCHGQYSKITRWHLNAQCNSSAALLKPPTGGSLDECQQIIIKPQAVTLETCSLPKVRKRRAPKMAKKPQSQQEFPALGYAMLLNFGVDGSAHTLYAFDGQQYLSKDPCTGSQIFNPFEQECIETTCPHNHISIKGKCVHQSLFHLNKLVACVDFVISYTFEEESLTGIEEELFKRSLANRFLGQYNASFRNTVLPSKRYNNKSQCSNIESFDDSFSKWNISEIHNVGYSELQSNWVPHDLPPKTPYTCSDLASSHQNRSSNMFIVSLKFNDLRSELHKLQEFLGRVNDSKLFGIINSKNNFTGYGCVSSANPQNVSEAWCEGFKSVYFNNEFVVLNTSSDANITGLRVIATNKTYTVSQFQYTKVVGNVTFWRNVTQMATTCDELPNIKLNMSTCIKMMLHPSNHKHESTKLFYELLPNRSLYVKQFEEFSNMERPFQTHPAVSIPNVFTVDEYEYVGKHANDSHDTTTSLNDNAVTICMPPELLALFIEIATWNSVNIKHSCDFLQTFGWGSSLTGFIFSAISIIAMVLVLLTYSTFKTLRTLPGISLMNLTVAVLLSQVLFLTNVLISSDLDDSNCACFATAVFTHFGTLSSFMWMNVMAYSSYRAFGADFKTRVSQLNRRHLVFNSLYGWGIPAVIVITCAIIDYALREQQLIAYGVISDIKVSAEHNTSTGLIDDVQIRYRTMATCWIGNSKAAVVIFGVPLVYSMVVNLVLFIRTCIGMREKRTGKPTPVLRRDSRSGHVKNRNEMAIHLRLSAQYGFAWIFAIIIIIIGTSRAESTVICYILYILNLIFNILNGCAGLFIFIAFIFNKRILHLYKAKLARFRSQHRKGKDNRGRLSSSRTISTISVSYSNSTSHLHR